jgi:hypothetical protein
MTIGDVTRACIFCGDSGLSSEHVWPRWGKPYVGASGLQPHERILEVAGRPTARDTYDAEVFDQKVRAVCERCNNGWMSRLEQRAKPLLLDLMAGRAHVLTRSDQQTLAVWAAKTTFVANETFPHPTGIAGEQRRYLARMGAPPPRSIVMWVGAYAGAQPGQFHQRGMAVSRPGERVTDGDDPNMWAATLSLGAVLFHLVGCADPKVLNVGAIAIGDLRLARLWPYRGTIRWPPRGAFTDLDVPVLADAVFDELQRHLGS